MFLCMTCDRAKQSKFPNEYWNEYPNYSITSSKVYFLCVLSEVVDNNWYIYTIVYGFFTAVFATQLGTEDIK